MIKLKDLIGSAKKIAKRQSLDGFKSMVSTAVPNIIKAVKKYCQKGRVSRVNMRRKTNSKLRIPIWGKRPSEF